LIDVLCVDDDESMLELVAMFVTHSGDFKIDTAASAREALAKISERKYDVVVCDYQMPEMTGIDLLSILRNQGNDVPFVIFTGKGREDVAIDALNRGADFYLQKSGDTRAMFAELANMITQSVMRRSAEQECRRVERMFHMLADNSQDVLYRIRIKPDVAIEYINPVVEKFSGYSAEEWIRDETVMFKVIHPDDLPKLDEALKDPDSHREPVMLRWIHKNGTVTWAEDIITPIRDQSGDIVAILGIARDMTDRIIMERALEEAYKKLSLLGNLIRHDTVNQLMVITGSVDLAKKTEDRERASAYLDKIDAAAMAIKDQLEFWMRYDKTSIEGPQWVAAEDLVTDFNFGINMKGAEFSTDLKGLEILADPMLGLVFRNLLENSLRHGDGVTRVRVWYERADGGLNIILEDNGVGIPAQDKVRIFWRGVGKGTGYGLYLAQKTLALAGMTIRETGEPGKGARFEVFIPEPKFRIKA